MAFPFQTTQEAQNYGSVDCRNKEVRILNFTLQILLSIGMILGLIAMISNLIKKGDFKEFLAMHFYLWFCLMALNSDFVILHWFIKSGIWWTLISGLIFAISIIYKAI